MEGQEAAAITTANIFTEAGNVMTGFIDMTGCCETVKSSLKLRPGAAFPKHSRLCRFASVNCRSFYNFTRLFP